LFGVVLLSQDDEKCFSIGGKSESGVVQLCSAAVVHIACSSLQNTHTSHDRQKDQSQHDSILDRRRAIFALQEPDEALHGEIVTEATVCNTFS
jgi:hypothetical protein